MSGDKTVEECLKNLCKMNLFGLCECKGEAFEATIETYSTMLEKHYRKKFEVDKKYNANFLWGKGELEEIGYEFANAKTEEYQKECWEDLLSVIRKKFVELLPKKKETEKLISFPEADFTSIRARREGYNQCLDDIKKVLEQ